MTVSPRARRCRGAARAAHPAIAAEAAGVAQLLAEQEDAYELIAGTAITAAP
jgi:hypothetical protein